MHFHLFFPFSFYSLLCKQQQNEQEEEEKGEEEHFIDRLVFSMQRVCFCKTVSLFNHVLQPSQAIALFYQSLIFSLKNLALIRWISSTIDIPTGLQLLMIDINGNVTVDDDLLYKHLSNAKREVEQRTDTTSVR